MQDVMEKPTCMDCMDINPKLDDQDVAALNAKVQKHIECKITAFDMDRE